jgi:hypothetical protein
VGSTHRWGGGGCEVFFKGVAELEAFTYCGRHILKDGAQRFFGEFECGFREVDTVVESVDELLGEVTSQKAAGVVP